MNITDKDVIDIAIGNEAFVRFDAYPDAVFKGIVREVAGTADPFIGTYEVEIEVLANGKKLLSGFIAQVEIKTRQENQVIRVPIDALFSADKMEGVVFVAEDGLTQKRSVQILIIEEEALLVTSGINLGDMVITSGVGYLEDNQSIQISKINRTAPITSIPHSFIPSILIYR